MLFYRVLFCILSNLLLSCNLGLAQTTYPILYGYVSTTDGRPPEAFASASPTTNICGDGIVQNPPEECDDGNNINGDGCSEDCHNEMPSPMPSP